MLVERVLGGVVVQVDVYEGGGFVPSHAVLWIARRVVAISEAGEA